MSKYIIYNGEELTVRKYLKVLKKKFKKMGLLDKRIEQTHFRDMTCLYIEDADAEYGRQYYKYGLDDDNTIKVKRG